MKLWASIKKWFLECWEATADGSIATSMWVDGYSDFEIEEELRQHAAQRKAMELDKTD